MCRAVRRRQDKRLTRRPCVVYKRYGTVSQCVNLSFARREQVAVKHTPTGEVHQGTKGGATGCGVDTTKNADHWVSSSERITCDKNGCKN